MKRHTFLTVAATTIAAAASAQTPVPQSRNTNPPTTPTFTFGPNGTIVWEKQNAPFSAILVERHEQTLSDGTHVSREFRETVMRDNQGRIYRAREINRAGRAEGEPGLIITITDPILHVRYFCTLMRKCIESQYRTAGISRGHFFADKAKGLTVEDLGTSTISGIEVQGERVTRVIAEEKIGNDRPITDVKETWHSKALGVDVQVMRTDPRIGMQNTLMTDISLGEPDPQYFQIPEGYTVRKLGPPGGLVAIPQAPAQ